MSAMYKTYIGTGHIVPNFLYIIEVVIEVDELDEGNISAAAGK